MQKSIIWFRQDLRLQDNPALDHAAKEGQVIAVYIFDPLLNLGSAQRWWLYHSLQSLKRELAEINIPLFFKQGDALTQLQLLADASKAKKIFWNRCFEPQIMLRDKSIKAWFKAQGTEVKTFNAHLLTEPMEIKNRQGNPFKLFTPYWKYCLSTFTPKTLLPMPQAQAKINLIFENDDIDILTTGSNFPLRLEGKWEIGEKAALKKLDDFINNKLAYYHELRDYPAKAIHSCLSAHLHFGEISPWRIWHSANEYAAVHSSIELALQDFLKELGWREFSYYLLYHFPSLPEKNVNSFFDRFRWEDKNNLELWQKGLTGFPIVDAGMRELWQTGYMHNRVRMIVASFLTKDLLIDWKEGAAWFWETLVDADLASNSVNWQWVAGCGIDPSPYFRIFNPVLQSKKFDKEGAYIKIWLPELEKLPQTYLHAPWEAPENILLAANIVLGKNYPMPIISHDEARKRALERYACLHSRNE